MTAVLPDMFVAGGVMVCCFVLPLADSPLWPAALALLLARRAVPGWSLAAVGAGWLLSWLWRLDFSHLPLLIDLALVGPLLAAGAAGVSRSRLRCMQIGLTAGAAVAACAALLQGVVGLANPAHWTGAAWAWSRVYGTLGNPNVLAAYLAAVLPFLWELPRRSLRAVLGTAAVAALILTASRGGWLAALAGTAFYLARRRPRVLPLFLLAAIIVIVLPLPIGDRLGAALSGRDSTVLYRLMLWRDTLALWWHSPLAGWGMTAPLAAAHPHNLVLEVLLRGGAAALTGFIVLLWDGLPRLRRLSAEKSAAAAALVALGIFGLGDAFLTQPALAGLFWLSWGMAVGVETGAAP